MARFNVCRLQMVIRTIKLSATKTFQWSPKTEITAIGATIPHHGAKGKRRRLASYRDGVLFATKFAGKGHWGTPSDRRRADSHPRRHWDPGNRARGRAPIFRAPRRNDGCRSWAALRCTTASPSFAGARRESALVRPGFYGPSRWQPSGGVLHHRPAAA
jgi:hypothetical protein